METPPILSSLPNRLGSSGLVFLTNNFQADLQIGLEGKKTPNTSLFLKTLLALQKQDKTNLIQILCRSASKK